MALTILLACTTAIFLALSIMLVFKNSDLSELLDRWVEYSEYQGTELEAAQTKLKSLQATNELLTEQQEINIKLIAELRREIEQQDVTIWRLAKESGNYMTKLQQLEASLLKDDNPSNWEVTDDLKDRMQKVLKPALAGCDSADVGTFKPVYREGKAPEGTTSIKVIPQYSYNPPPAPQPWPAVYADVKEHKPQPLPNDYA